MSELLTGGTGSFNAKQMKEQRQRIVDSWAKSGLLAEVTGHTKINIAQMLEGQASAMLNEVREEDNADEPVVMPIVKKVLDEIGDNPILPISNLPKDLHIYIKKDNEESEGTSTDSSTL